MPEVIHAEHLEEASRTLDRLVGSGFTVESSKKFVKTGRVDELKHTGMFPVQLYRPTLDEFSDEGKQRFEDMVVEAFYNALHKGRINLPRSAGGTLTRQVLPGPRAWFEEAGGSLDHDPPLLPGRASGPPAQT